MDQMFCCLIFFPMELFSLLPYLNVYFLKNFCNSSFLTRREYLQKNVEVQKEAIKMFKAEYILFFYFLISFLISCYFGSFFTVVIFSDDTVFFYSKTFSGKKIKLLVSKCIYNYSMSLSSQKHFITMTLNERKC